MYPPMSQSTTSSPSRRRPLSSHMRLVPSSLQWVALLVLSSKVSSGFLHQAPLFPSSVSLPSSVHFPTAPTAATLERSWNSRRSVPSTPSRSSSSPSSSALNVWWFGGTEQSEIDNAESCELVAVRIERTSPNSRRIAGEIAVPAPMDAVWSILTDYNRLAIHVPNLMESKVVKENSRTGTPGDGSYRCRLYQVGAQKIIGFDFSASVTMDMTERIIASSAVPARKIDFKCVDSQFFSEFDGAWTVKEQRNPSTGEVETLCSYVVDVRPKGPVPVAALEWRIREDVPTNLRAVKAATMGMAQNALAVHSSASASTTATPLKKTARKVNPRTVETNGRAFPVRIRKHKQESGNKARVATMLMDWDVDETMAKYL